MTNAPPPAREPQLMLADVARELLWTRALRTPALALRPGRVVLGTAGALGAALIGSIPFGPEGTPTFAESLSGSFAERMSDAAGALTQASAPGFGIAIARLALLPGELLTERPWSTVLLGIPMLVVLALFGGAIARSASVEFGTARFTEWTDDLRASLHKLGASAAALIAPLAFAGALLALLAAGGWMLGVPVLDVLASLLYGIGLAIALLALGVLVLHALAMPMIVPAVLAEGTDAIDAVQRCYAYVLARPLHLLAHASLVLVLGAVSIGVFATVLNGADTLASWASTRWTSDAGLAVVQGSADLSATQPAARAVIEFWHAVRDLLISGFAISYFFTAGSVLYLIARRICDGQDPAELWDGRPDAD